MNIILKPNTKNSEGVRLCLTKKKTNSLNLQPEEQEFKLKNSSEKTQSRLLYKISIQIYEDDKEELEYNLKIRENKARTNNSHSLTLQKVLMDPLKNGEELIKNEPLANFGVEDDKQKENERVFNKNLLLCKKRSHSQQLEFENKINYEAKQKVANTSLKYADLMGNNYFSKGKAVKPSESKTYKYTLFNIKIYLSLICLRGL
jgi:hypothetical protein